MSLQIDFFVKSFCVNMYICLYINFVKSCDVVTNRLFILCNMYICLYINFVKSCDVVTNRLFILCNMYICLYINFVKSCDVVTNRLLFCVICIYVCILIL